MPSWKFILTGLALLLFIVLIVIPAFIIGTKTGTGFLLRTASDKIAGLQYTLNEPRALFRGLSFSDVKWSSDGTHVHAKNVDLTLSYFCEEGFALCVNTIALSKLDAEIADSETPPEDKKPPSLPTIKTPIGVIVKSVDLNNISLKGSNASPWTNEVSWQASTLKFKNSQLSIGDSKIHNALFSHEMRGQIELNGDYPLALNQRIVAKPPQLSSPIDATIALSNTVKDLAIHLQTKAPDALNIEARLAPLDKVLHGELRLGLQTLDPNSIMTVPLTELNGTAFARFSIDPDAQQFHIDARSKKLSFTYREIPYHLTTDINTDQSGVIHIKRLTLASANTDLELNAVVQAFTNSDFANIDSTLNWLKNLKLQGQFTAKKLSELADNIAGNISTAITFTPGEAVTLDAKGAALELAGTQIQQVSLDAKLPLDLSSEQALSVNLHSTDIVSGTTQLDKAQATVSGSYGAHQMSVSASSDKFTADSRLTGALASDKSHWSGTLDALQALAHHPKVDQRIRLEKATSLQWQFDPESIRIAAGCFAVNQAQLCTSEATISPANTSLDFTLNHLASNSLTAWWPDSFTWNGELNGKGSLRKTGNGAPVIAITLDGPPGHISSTIDETAITQAYQSIAINANANDSGFEAALHIARENKTDLLRSQITLSGQDFAKLQGTVALSHFDLAAIAGLMPDAEIVEGIVDVNLQLAGDTQSPEITGSSTLSKGRFRLRDNPSDLRDMQLKGLFKQNSITLNGDFKLGEGIGRIDGQFALTPPVNGTLRLWGDKLEISSPPMISLATTMDINIGVSPETIAITGEIAVPEGDITIAELPESAESLSSDVMIVDSNPEVKAKSQGPAMIMDLTASIGPNLSFKGFGASTKLQGKLKLEQTAGNPLQGTGAIDLVDGRYRGYGQKLNVRTGRLLFNGPVSSPNIELEAIRTIDETIAGIKVSGAATAPEITPFAEPAMSNSDTLYAILTGKLPDDDSGTDKDAVVAQALLAGGLALGGGSISSGAEKLGISNFNIGSGDDTDLSVSGYIRNDVFLEYGVNALGDGREFKVRWDFAKRLSLEMINSLHNSLDLLYSRSF